LFESSSSILLALASALSPKFISSSVEKVPPNAKQMFR
jgi:hypothetical protein